MNWYLIEKDGYDTVERKLSARDVAGAYKEARSLMAYITPKEIKKREVLLVYADESDDGICDYAEAYDLKKNVMNEHGVMIDFDAAVALMDENLFGYILTDDPQAFFDKYCELHLDEYGEPFELSKENPVW